MRFRIVELLGTNKVEKFVCVYVFVCGRVRTIDKHHHPLAEGGARDGMTCKKALVSEICAHFLGLVSTKIYLAL